MKFAVLHNIKNGLSSSNVDIVRKACRLIYRISLSSDCYDSLNCLFSMDFLTPLNNILESSTDLKSVCIVLNALSNIGMFFLILIT